MPCKSDGPYYDSVALAVILIYRHLDELAGKPPQDRHWGFLSVTRSELDRLTALLCERLKSVDLAPYSLELQMWYRDHQAADKARDDKRVQDNALEARKHAALAKLTDEERELLGFFRLRKMSDAI